MTFDELEIEADKMGYKLVAKKRAIKVEPCPFCGNTQMAPRVYRKSNVFEKDGAVISCRRCKRIRLYWSPDEDIYMTKAEIDEQARKWWNGYAKKLSKTLDNIEIP